MGFLYAFHTEILTPENAVYLLSENRKSVLRGRLYVLLAGQLLKEKSMDQMMEELGSEFSRERVHEILTHMMSRGYIEERKPESQDEENAFWHGLCLDPEQVANGLHKGIRIRNLMDTDTSLLERTLAESGFPVSEKGHLTLVIADDYQNPHLAEINREFLVSGKPWLLLKPTGNVLWIGPLFLPEKTGCWACMENRLRANREIETLLQRRVGRNKPFPVFKGRIHASLSAAFSLTAVEAVRALTAPDTCTLFGRLMTLDMKTMETRYHTVPHRPQCRICGDPAVLDQAGQAIEFSNRIKTFTEDGGHRICSPAETLERFSSLISPLTGVVSDVKPVFTGGSGLVSIYGGFHRIANSGSTLDNLNVYLRNNSTGKGRSSVQSRASAFSEAVERYCSIYTEEKPVVRKSTCEMGADGIAVNDCMLFSKHQYENRQDWNREYGYHVYVPEPLDPDLSIDWARVWSLTEERERFLPAAYAYLMYNDPSGTSYFVPESNGLAAGNVIEEAFLQGFMEVVERDSVSIWWYNRLRVPGVDLDSFSDPYFEAIQTYYQSLGRNLWVLDVTNDFGIPTFVAVSNRPGQDRELIIYGCGTHLDPRIGISRAITEMNQLLYIQDQGRMSNATTSRDNMMKRLWFDSAHLESEPYLAPNPDQKKKTAADYQVESHTDLLDDITYCLSRARDLSLEVLLLDMTEPDVGMPVVRVVVPGARLFRPRFAPGRLYDVPVILGHSSAPLTEDKFNPRFIWI